VPFNQSLYGAYTKEQIQRRFEQDPRGTLDYLLDFFLRHNKTPPKYLNQIYYDNEHFNESNFQPPYYYPQRPFRFNDSKLYHPLFRTHNITRPQYLLNPPYRDYKTYYKGIEFDPYKFSEEWQSFWNHSKGTTKWYNHSEYNHSLHSYDPQGKIPLLVPWIDVSRAAKESLAECLISADPNYGTRLLENLGFQYLSWIIRSPSWWLTWADVHYNANPLMSRSSIYIRLLVNLIAKFGATCLNSLIGIVPYAWENIKWYCEDYCGCPCVDDRLMYYRDIALNATIMSLNGFADWFCYDRLLYFLEVMEGVWAIILIAYFSYRIINHFWEGGCSWLLRFAPHCNELYDPNYHHNLKDMPRWFIPLYLWINNISYERTFIFSRPNSRRTTPVHGAITHNKQPTWWHCCCCPCYLFACIVMCIPQTAVACVGSIRDLFRKNKVKKQ
jgi:hypothetical protein